MHLSRLKNSFIKCKYKYVRPREKLNSSSSWSHVVIKWMHTLLTSCVRGETICLRSSLHLICAQAPRAPPSRCNEAVVFHAEYVLTVTVTPESRAKAAVSKSACWPWPLVFWPWKWCPSLVWCGLPLCQFWSSWLLLWFDCSRLRPDVPVWFSLTKTKTKITRNEKITIPLTKTKTKTKKYWNWN